MKRTILLTALAGSLLLTGCQTATESTKQVSTPETSTTEETTTTRFETTKATENTQPTTTSISESKSDTISDKEEYLKELLGDGEILVDDRTETGFYCRMVDDEGRLNTYFELPDDNLYNNCYIIAEIITSLTEGADTDGYTAISYIFADQTSNTIAIYSVNKYSGKWSALLPIFWYNEEYEEVWNKLMSGENPSEESKSESEVIYDENEIKVTYNSFEIESYTGNVILKILIENNSDSDLIIRPQDFYTNGYKTSVGGAWKILPGKKANEEIMIYKSELEDNNIEKVEQVEFSFSISVNDKLLNSDRITINL